MGKGSAVAEAAKSAVKVVTSAVPSKVGISRLAIAVPAGPIFENEWTSGVSHVARRQAYKDNFVSSAWRTEWNLSNAGLRLGNNGVGADLLARMFLVYSVVGPTETVLQDGVLSKLAQMVFFPRFHPRDLQLNEDFVKTELKYLKTKTPVEYVRELLIQNAFSGPLANPAFCPDHNLKWAKSNELWNWWQKHYHIGNVQVVATNADQGHLEELIGENQWFNSAAVTTGGVTPEASQYTGGQYTSIHRREYEFDEQFSVIEETWTGVGLKGPEINNHTKYLAGLIAKGALDIKFGGVEAEGVSLAKINYEALYGGGLFSVVFTNIGGKGLSEEAQAKKVKDALQESANAAAFAGAKAAAKRELIEKLDDGILAADELILSYLHSGNVSTLAADLDRVTLEDYRTVVQAAVSAPPTLVFYGGKPLQTS